MVKNILSGGIHCHFTILLLFGLNIVSLKTCSASDNKSAFVADAQRVISVKTFGAKGDGITNDRAAIQKAVAVAGRSVNFPAGNYRVDGFIKVADGVKLTGTPGSTIIASANVKPDPATGSSHQ